MFGVKTNSKGMLSVSQEVATQHAVVAEEVRKLHELSGLGWYVIEHKCFTKMCNTNFRNGMLCGAALTVVINLTIAALNSMDTSEEE